MAAARRDWRINSSRSRERMGCFIFVSDENESSVREDEWFSALSSCIQLFTGEFLISSRNYLLNIVHYIEYSTSETTNFCPNIALQVLTF